MGSVHFQTYVANVNRIRLIELIDTWTSAQQACRPASLIINPVTGLPYAPAVED